ncbi:MAG: type II toxin-antitoxin system HicB family antitoxin [Bacteroidota bacterium]
MKEYEFTILLEKEEGGRYTATCPSLPGCYTQGESEQEAREMIKDAIRLHLEERIANKEPIPSEVEVSTIRIAV